MCAQRVRIYERALGRDAVFARERFTAAARYVLGTSAMQPARALAELKAQHDMLRGMMDRCEAFADELEAGRCGPLQLTREVSRLRSAFDAHNRFEEEMLRPVLLAGMPPEAMAQQIEEHVEAHRSMRTNLASNETTMLRDVIDAMRAHLDAEERYLQTAQTVRSGAKVPQ